MHATLQRAAAQQGLRFGPDPSTHTRCTIGGMVGNNACGTRALGYGRTADNVVALDALFPEPAAAAALPGIVEAHLGHVRTHFGRFSRQVSGYSLEHLLPERRSLDRFLVGSEGTLALVREATVALVPRRAAAPGGARLRVDGRGRRCGAGPARAVGAGCSTGRVRRPRLPDRRPRARAVAACPSCRAGSGWLFVEVAGPDAEALLRSAIGGRAR